MRILNQLIGHKMPKPKTLNEIIRESNKLKYPFQHFSTIIISEPRGKEQIIKGVAQSGINNLIMDNFGKWLAIWFRSPISGQNTVVLKDITDTNRNVICYDNQQNFNQFNVDAADILGTSIQIGSGSTPATRADVNVETAFIVAPEDALFDTGNGAYGAGGIAIVGAIVAGGAGTIAEVCLFAQWTWTDTLASFLLFHDILGATEAFVLGDTITATYTINL